MWGFRERILRSPKIDSAPKLNRVLQQCYAIIQPAPINPFAMSVSFYTSNLDANTAFVLDRRAFLDTIVDAVEHEDWNANAAKMIAVLTENSFIPIVARLTGNNDGALQRGALHAIGNLIASNNPVARAKALSATLNELKSIEKAFGSDKSRYAAAYVCANLAQFMSDKDCPIVRQIVLNGLVDGVATEMSPTAVRDLLRAIKYLSAERAVPREVLLDLLSARYSKRTVRAALDILGDQVSDETAADDFDALRFRTYEVLRSLLLDVPLRIKDRVIYFWTLSNLVVESGIPDTFLTDAIFVEKVCEHCTRPAPHQGSKHHFDSVFNAVWSIINAIVKSDLICVSYSTLELLQNTLLTAACSLPPTSTVQGNIREALEKIALVLTPLESEDVDMERTDDDVGGTTILPASSTDTPVSELPQIKIMPLFPEGYIAPCAAPAPCEVFYPPNALELLYKNNSTSVSSHVNSLIQKLINNNLAPTPLDSNLILAVSDLKELEQRGFVVSHSHLMINPAILTTVYSA